MLCEICGHDRQTPTRHTNVYGMGADLVECDRCCVRFYKWNKAPHKTYSEFYNSDAYDEYTRRHISAGTPDHDPAWDPEVYRQSSDNAYRRMVGRINDVLKESAPAHQGPLRLYEAGCAWGQFLLVAKGKGAVVTGCDLGRENVKEAINRGLYVEHCTFQEATLGKVSAVVMLDMIEHTETPGADLKKAAEHLEPGGVLLVKTFYDEWHDTLPGLDLSDKQVDLPTTGYFAPIAHPFHFTTAALISAMSRAGFDVVDISHESTYGQVTIYATHNRDGSP